MLKDVKVERMQRVAGEDKVEIIFLNHSGERETFIVDYVLAATGRRSNIDNLSIDKTSIELDQICVPVADNFTMQTSFKHIFIA